MKKCSLLGQKDQSPAKNLDFGLLTSTNGQYIFTALNQNAVVIYSTTFRNEYRFLLKCTFELAWFITIPFHQNTALSSEETTLRLVYCTDLLKLNNGK